jgi:hypothetical protein
MGIVGKCVPSGHFSEAEKNRRWEVLRSLVVGESEATIKPSGHIVCGCSATECFLSPFQYRQTAYYAKIQAPTLHKIERLRGNLSAILHSSFLIESGGLPCPRFSIQTAPSTPATS